MPISRSTPVPPRAAAIAGATSPSRMRFTLAPSSPLKSIGASSFSPSPITTRPSIETVSSIVRIASTAAWSALSFSPRPIQRAAPSAAASVTRTSSRARFRSCLISTFRTLHPFGRRDSDEIEAAGDDALCGAHELEPERLRLGADHTVLVVEAMEVVRHADGVDGDRVRSPAFRCLGGDRGKLEQPLDQVALLLFEHGGGVTIPLALGVAEDPRDTGMRVLHVVDGILLRALGCEIDVDVDRLVVAARHEIPTRSVDADLVDQLVEEDDVPAPLRDLL